MNEQQKYSCGARECIERISAHSGSASAISRTPVEAPSAPVSRFDSRFRANRCTVYIPTCSGGAPEFILNCALLSVPLLQSYLPCNALFFLLLSLGGAGLFYEQALFRERDVRRKTPAVRRCLDVIGRLVNRRVRRLRLKITSASRQIIHYCARFWLFEV